MIGFRYATYMKIVVLLVLSSVTIVAGCEVAPEPLKPSSKSLSIAYYDEDAFYREYGDYFDAKFPDTEIRIIPFTPYDPVIDSYKLTADMIEKEQPDLIILNDNSLFGQLAEQEKLYDISNWVRRYYDADGVTPGILDTLRGYGNGKLYGLAPFFSSTALFYNKTLFDTYKVPYPTDRMSWEEMLTLAERFTGAKNGDGKPVVGYHQAMMTEPFDLVLRVGQTYGLSTIDAELSRVTIDTKPWNHVFTFVADALKRGLFAQTAVKGSESNGVKHYTIESILQANRFLHGQAAMTLGGPSDMEPLKTAGFEWGTVTEPVDPANPEKATSTQIYPIFCISANAQNPEKAFEVIQYFSGDNYAKVSSKINSGNTAPLSIRKWFTVDRNGNSLESFYKLRPVKSTIPAGGNTLQSFYPIFNGMVNDEIEEILMNKKTTKEALATLQNKGQALIDQIKLAQKNKQADK